MFKKIDFAKPIIKKKTFKYINKVLSSGRLSHGPFIEKFENKFSEFVGSNSAVAVSSCTTGLNICYSECGVREGTEVIVPALTHVASAHAAAYLGATIRFADVDPATGNVTVESVVKLVNKRTVAICLVHFLGALAPVKKIQLALKKKKIKIIEDCAIALGSYHNKKHVGLIGDYGCFSFYPSKHITSGEGGMVISKHKTKLKNIRKLRSFGYTADLNDRKIPGIYNISQLGYNYRMSELSAAVGVSQLERIEFLLNKRKSNYNFYKKEFTSMGRNFIKTDSLEHKNTPFLFNLIAPTRKIRDKIITECLAKKIQLSVHYPVSLNKSLYYKKKNSDKCPNAEMLSSQMISLPTGPHMTKDMLKRVVNTIIKII